MSAAPQLSVSAVARLATTQLSLSPGAVWPDGASGATLMAPQDMPTTLASGDGLNASFFGSHRMLPLDSIGELERLLQFVAGANSAIAELPAKPARNVDQALKAQALLDAVRLARQRFMRRHAQWVYAHLTNEGTERLRLSALCEAAARFFPGLVPSPEQMQHERRCLQSDKDGLERDLAVFLAELLSQPQVGEHLLESMRMVCPRALELQAEYLETGSLRLPSVLLERKGVAAYLTVCNADTLNAEDDALVADLEVAGDLALLDPAVRVGVLRGGQVNHSKYAGRRVFSSGINLKHLHGGRISFVEFLLEREMGFVSKLYQGLLLKDEVGHLQRISKPWLAAVDSFAIGGGTQLLLVFDSVIAAEGSYFSLPAAKEGIVPGVANLRLSRYVGAKLARRIILHGHVVHAHDPEAAMLVDKVVKPEQMDIAIEASVRELDNPAVVANRTIFNQAEEPLSLFRAYMAEFALQQSERAYSEDVRAKVARYVSEHRSEQTGVGEQLRRTEHANPLSRS